MITYNAIITKDNKVYGTLFSSSDTLLMLHVKSFFYEDLEEKDIYSNLKTLKTLKEFKDCLETTEYNIFFQEVSVSTKVYIGQLNEQ